MRERFRDDVRRDLTLAWNVAALQRQKRLPRLETMLAKVGAKSGPQTVEQQRSMLQMLSDMYGGSLQPTKPTKSK